MKKMAVLLLCALSFGCSTSSTGGGDPAGTPANKPTAAAPGCKFANYCTEYTGVKYHEGKELNQAAQQSCGNDGGEFKKTGCDANTIAGCRVGKDGEEYTVFIYDTASMTELNTYCDGKGTIIK